jgi:uncharacterized membrane protein
MTKYSPMLVILLPNSSSFACISCNNRISDGIYNSAFYPNLFTMLLAFIVLAIIVFTLILFTAKRYKLRSVTDAKKENVNPVPLTSASIILGIGLGGFIDGIVLHQIMQWHEMLSNKIPANEYVGKSINMFWDGIFHLFCFLIVLTGIVLLWKLLSRKDVDHSGKLLAGGLLLGWGLFNIVEGIIDHQILKLHNVIEYAANHNIGNFTFLGASIVMILAGYLMVKVKS